MILSKYLLYYTVDLYDRTVEPVKYELLTNHSEENWHKWVDKWSELSLEDFLRGDKYQSDDGYKLRPWPEAAIEAFKVSIAVYKIKQLSLLRTTFVFTSHVTTSIWSQKAD